MKIIKNIYILSFSDLIGHKYIYIKSHLTGRFLLVFPDQSDWPKIRLMRSLEKKTFARDLIVLDTLKCSCTLCLFMLHLFIAYKYGRNTHLNLRRILVIL